MKVLLSVILNTLFTEINLSQIRTLDIKREKIYAVCPYLLFFLYGNYLNFKGRSETKNGLEIFIRGPYISNLNKIGQFV